MATQTYDQATEWLAHQKTELSNYQYGNNDVTVRRSVSEMTQRFDAINTFEGTTLPSVVDKTTEDKNKLSLEGSCRTVKTLCEKRLNDLTVLSVVTSLEENCTQISRVLDTGALQLARNAQTSAQQQDAYAQNIPGFISAVSQDSIVGLRDNWNWITTLSKCINIHLKNAADYHRFFHEVKETEPWMLQDLSSLSKCLETQNVTGSEDEVKKLVEELKIVNVTLRQWEAKINRFWDTAVHLRPLPLRVDGVTQPTPATSLCDYRTSQITVREGEDILLLENSNPRSWKVRNGRGQEAEIPSVTVLIAGPDPLAIEAAIKLRLQLLAAWTEAMKLIGARIIRYLMLVFKPDYSMQEIVSLQSVRSFDKQSLLDLLSFIEDTLMKQWSDHEGFIALQERILALRMILEDTSEDQSNDESLFNKLLLQVTLLSQIIELYQILFGDWEKYKVAVEASQQPELMLIVDKWTQLQFVSREYFAKLWKTKLPVDATGSFTSGINQFTIDGESFEDTVKTNEVVGAVSPPRLFTMTSTETTDGGQVIFSVPDIEDHTLLTTIAVDDIDSNDNKLSTLRTTTYTTTTLDSSTATRVTQTGKSGGAIESTTMLIPGKASSGDRAEVTFIVDLKGQSGSSETGGSSATATGADGRGKGSSGKGDEGKGSSGEGFDEHGTRTEVTRIIQGSKDEKSAGREIKAAEIRVAKTAVLRTSVTGGGNDDGSYEEGFDEVSATTTSRVSGSEYEGTDFGVATERKTAETEQLTAAEVEEKKTFIIRSVIHPIEGNEISLQQAIALGVIRPDAGCYVNIATGESKPIATAMNEGLIKVMFTTTKRSQEKTSSVGIITVKTIRESVRPYVVHTARDTQTGADLSLSDAVNAGIIDERHGSYVDRKTGRRSLMTEAAERELVKIEFTGPAPEPEVISKTYAVRAVVDRRLKKTVTFHEAVRRGIIERDSGAYKDTLTGEKMYVGDAIMRGFLKARVIDDPSRLDIDPSNRMVIDKTEKIRKKLLKPLQAISALKLAAAAASKSK